MARRLTGAFTSEDFARAMKRVCPIDAEMDEDLKRLLDRMGGDPAKARALTNGH